jgi:2-polyprenyl-3-methyl-5-hydroxy-6-metoxy-1,4-benzoquinol methylase
VLTKYKNKITFTSTHKIAYQIIQEQSKVLSIGCGRGFVEYYLEKNKKCEIKGIDVLNKKLVKINNYKQKNLNLIRFNKLNYDYLLLLDVLEHLDDPYNFLYKIKRSTNGKKKNTLIISVPNIANIWIRLNLLFGNFDYSERGILDKTHKIFFTLDSLKKMIHKQGFCIKKIYYIPIPFPLFIKNEYLSSFFISIYNIFTQLFSKIFSYQYLIVVEKN